MDWDIFSATDPLEFFSTTRQKSSLTLKICKFNFPFNNVRFFEYMEKKYNDRVDAIQQYTFSDYPKDLQKKVTLLQHFKNYLESDKEQVDFKNIYIYFLGV
jgi:hypothetical protein